MPRATRRDAMRTFPWQAVARAVPCRAVRCVALSRCPDDNGTTTSDGDETSDGASPASSQSALLLRFASSCAARARARAYASGEGIKRSAGETTASISRDRGANSCFLIYDQMHNVAHVVSVGHMCRAPGRRTSSARYAPREFRVASHRGRRRVEREQFDIRGCDSSVCDETAVGDATAISRYLSRR